MNLQHNPAERKVPKGIDYPDAWYHFALELTSKAQYKDALQIADRSWRSSQGFLKIALLRVHLLSMTGDVGLAFQSFRNLYQTHKDDPFFRLSMGVFLMRHGWNSEGARLLEQFASGCPRSAYAQYFAQAAMEECGAHLEAERHKSFAEAAIHNLPDGWCKPHSFDDGHVAKYRSWPIPDVLTVCQDPALDFSTRERMLRAHAAMPGHLDLMVQVARSYAAEDAVAVGISWLKAALRIDATYAPAHFELAFCLDVLQDPDLVELHFETAVKERPTYPDYRMHFATFLASREKWHDAVDQLEKAILVAPDFVEAKLRLAEALLKVGRTQESLDYLQSDPLQSWQEAADLAASCERPPSPG